MRNKGVGSREGGGERGEEFVGDADHDLNRSAHQGAESMGIGVEELNFGDVVPAEQIDDDRRREAARGESAPVDADGRFDEEAGSREEEEEEHPPDRCHQSVSERRSYFTNESSAFSTITCLGRVVFMGLIDNLGLKYQK